MEKQRGSLFNSDTVTGIFGVLFGAWWLIMSLQLPGTTAKDGTPGPSVFPTGLSVLLIVLSVVMIFVGIKNKVSFFNFKEISKSSLLCIGLSLVLFVVFLVLWNFFHYILASFVLSLGLALLYKIKPITGILLAAIFSVGTYFAFTMVLKVMLDIAR